MRECALIYLKICMVATAYADYFSLKFEKDPLSSCGEINVLLSLEQFCDKPEKTKGSVQKIRLALNWPPPMPMTVFIF